MNTFVNEENINLLEVINILQKELIRVGLQEGLTNQKTIALSQRLDAYIAKYQVVANNFAAMSSYSQGDI